MTVFKSLLSIVVDSIEVLGDRFLLVDFVVSFCFRVGFIVVSIDAIGAVGTGFDAVGAVGVVSDVVSGLLFCFLFFFILIEIFAGHFCHLTLEFHHLYRILIQLFLH